MLLHLGSSFLIALTVMLFHVVPLSMKIWDSITLHGVTQHAGQLNCESCLHLQNFIITPCEFHRSVTTSRPYGCCKTLGFTACHLRVIITMNCWLPNTFQTYQDAIYKCASIDAPYASQREARPSKMAVVR
jgi:hypothetical protein